MEMIPVFERTCMETIVDLDGTSSHLILVLKGTYSTQMGLFVHERTCTEVTVIL